jgi:endo-1,4-beta-xylanase
MNSLATTRVSVLSLCLGFALLAAGCDDADGSSVVAGQDTGGAPAAGAPNTAGGTGGTAPITSGGTGGSGTGGATSGGTGGSPDLSGSGDPVDCGAKKAATLAEASAVTERLFGAALSAGRLGSDSQFADTAAAEFNYVTPENEMKWSYLEPTPGTFSWTSAETIVSFAEKHNMKVKGHTLVWHSQLPGWVGELADKASVEAALKRHVQTVAGHFKGRVYAWDVVNEAFSDAGTPVIRDTVFYKYLGEGFIEQAFRWAHEADPDALLLYNDYGIERPGKKVDAVYDLVSKLLKAGVPIHGVGFQTHVSAAGAPTKEQFATVLKRFTDLGLWVNISEMDVRIGGSVTGDLPARLTAQQTVYANLVSACVENERCHAITTWGITDKYSWLNMKEFWSWAGQGPHYPLLFDDSYARKPAWDGVMTALCKNAPVPLP